MRRLLALWLSLVPVQPALAAIAPPPDRAALCTSHGCCARPAIPRRPAAARSCHGSSAGSILAACAHDPVMAAPASTPPYLAASAVGGFVLDVHAVAPPMATRAVPDAFPGVDPPPPRSPAA
jgi:hypothetical protein